MSIAQYNKAKIYSGCDESVAVISVPSEADDYGRPLPSATVTSFRFQLPYGGKKAFEPCLFHQEFKFSQNDVVPAYIVPLNATDEARLTGFADRLQSNPQCATAQAQFMKNLQLSNQPSPGVYVYDTLFFWDTLAATSIWKDYVNFEDFSDLEITTLTNGDPTTVTGQVPPAELFRRDLGNLFRRGRYNHPVKLALSAKPAEGDPDLKTTIQNYVISLACTARQ